MRSGARLAAGLLALGCLAAPPAHAGRYDVQLSRFATIDEGRVIVDEGAYERMVYDLGVAVLPRFGAPASTVGSLGFDLGYALVLTDIDQTGSQWTQPVDDPGSTLKASQFFLRKGLPYSLELGGVVTRVHDSRLWGLALEVKWALVEGFRAAPDIALRAHVGTLLGSRDLALLTTGGDFLVSKGFGLGGLVQLTPYAGYQGTYLRANSHVVGLFPAGGLEPTTFIMPDQNLGAHRGLLGLRVLAGAVDLGFEAAFGKTNSYAFRAGLSF